MREIPEGLTLGAQNTLQQHILNWGHYYQLKDFVDSLRIPNQSYFFFFWKDDFDCLTKICGFISLADLFDFVGLCLWFTFVAVRQRRRAKWAENSLNKMKHAKNVVYCRETEAWAEKIEHMLFQPSPSSELPVCKTWWEAREACIYIGSTCYDVIFPAPLLVFIIIPFPYGVQLKPFLLTLEKLISVWCIVCTWDHSHIPVEISNRWKQRTCTINVFLLLEVVPGEVQIKGHF